MQYITAKTPDGGEILINTDKIIAIEAMSAKVIDQVHQQMRDAGHSLDEVNVYKGGTIIHTSEAKLVSRSSPEELLASIKTLTERSNIGAARSAKTKA